MLERAAKQMLRGMRKLHRREDAGGVWTLEVDGHWQRMSISPSSDTGRGHFSTQGGRGKGGSVPPQSLLLACELTPGVCIGRELAL